MDSLRCACGKIAKYENNLRFNNKQIAGWVCSCGERYYNPAAAELILVLNKLGKAR